MLLSHDATSIKHIHSANKNSYDLHQLSIDYNFIRICPDDFTVTAARG